MSVEDDEEKALVKGAREGFNYFGVTEDARKEPLFKQFALSPDDYQIDQLSMISEIKKNIGEYYLFTVTDYGGGVANTSVLFCAKNMRTKQLLIYDELDLKPQDSGVSNTVKEIFYKQTIHGLKPAIHLLDSQAKAIAVNFSEDSKETYLSVYSDAGESYQMSFGIINRKAGGKSKAKREEIVDNQMRITAHLSHPISKTGTGTSIYVAPECKSLIDGLMKSKVTRGESENKTNRQPDKYHMIKEDSVDAFYYAVCEVFSTVD